MSKTQKTTAPKKNKSAGYRVLSVLILLACVGVLFVPISTFQGDSRVKAQTIITTIQMMFDSGETVFGFLPVLHQTTGILNFAMNTAFYTLVIAVAIALILSLIAIFSKKGSGAILRTAVSFLMWGNIVYALSIVCITTYTGNKVDFDLYTTIIAVVFSLVYLMLLFIKLGKAGWLSILQYLLILTAGALLIMATTLEGKELPSANRIDKNILFVLLGITLLNLFISTFHAMSTRGIGGDLARYAFQLVAALVACYVGYSAKLVAGKYLLYCIIAAAISTLQIIFVTIQLIKRGKSLAEISAKEALANFETEEYIEAYVYEGGPVAGVEVAEEVTPTAASAAGNEYGKPNLAGLVGNGFDAFLFTLNEEEKAEFIDLYVLKCKTNMPEIPAYVVGGDNKEFFNKVFIYLGQYREKIPSTLLTKMYRFSMKLS